MRLTVSLFAFLAASTVETTAAGQIRGGDVTETGTGILHSNILGNVFGDQKAEDTGSKSTKKKDMNNEDNKSDFEEVSDVVDNLEDDEVTDDDGGTADDDDGGDEDALEDGFQLRDLFFPCQLLQAQFELPISCKIDVFDSLKEDGTVGAVVEVNDRVCSPALLNREACVSPVYSAYFGLTNFAVSSRIDFTNITVGEFELGDIGIELEGCGFGSGLSNGFCGCEASYNGEACTSCEICGLGNGNPFRAVELDCTNLVPLLSNFNTCQEINVLETLNGGNVQVSVPNFIKELEFR